MGSWITLIGSSLVGAFTLLSLMRFTIDMSQTHYLETMENLTYDMLAQAVEVVEGDISRAGLGVTDAAEDIIQAADSTNFQFRLDIDGDGTVDNLRYFLGDTTSAAGSPNPRDRALFRSVNGGQAADIAVGLTDFKLKYYDQSGNETTVAADIRTIRIQMSFESTTIYDSQYARLSWEGKITPINLVSH